MTLVERIRGTVMSEDARADRALVGYAKEFDLYPMSNRKPL